MEAMPHYYRGPWQWRTEIEPGWYPPPGCSGLDLRSLPEQAQQGGTPGLGLFLTFDEGAKLGSDYDLIGRGHWGDEKPTTRVKDSLPKRSKYAVKGDDLLGMIWDLLTDGADPVGDEFARPLMPEHDGRLALHFGRSHHERFGLAAGHASKVRDVLQADFRKAFADVQAGKSREGHHQRYLDALCEKYGTEDWQQFVPADLRTDVPGRLKHETTISETFNTADSSTLGPNLTWAEPTGNFEVFSNYCRPVNATFSEARAESDLSSADHWSEFTLLSVRNDLVNQGDVRALVRFDPSARTHYGFATGPAGGTTTLIFKRVAGTFNAMGSGGAHLTAGQVIRCNVNGSSVTGMSNGSTWGGPLTDTAITGFVRCGIAGRQIDGVNKEFYLDGFQASDQIAAGTNYTQLERGTRGILRGVYTRY